MLDRLRGLVAGVPAFEHRLVRTDWFGEDELWLASEDDSDCRMLTGLVSDAFPAYPPYGGQFDEVMPHLATAGCCGLSGYRHPLCDRGGRVSRL